MIVRSTARLVLYFILTSVILTFFFTMSPAVIHDGLDPSWRAALLQARHLDLGFGNQIVFAGGPLSHVYSKGFSSSLFAEQLASTVLFTVFYLAFLIDAIRRSGNSFVAVVGIMPFFLSVVPDALYVGLPLCASLLGTRQPQARSIRALVALGAAASAIATLAKFSVFPAAVIGFLLVDALAVRNRRFPVAIIAYGLSLAATFRVTSPNGVLTEFIRNSLDFSAGYSEAMSLSGSFRELCLVAVGTLTLVGLAAVNEFRNAGDDKLQNTAAVSRVVIIFSFLFVCIKAGLVRHDAHAVIAWQGLSVAASAYCVFSWRRFSPRMAAAFVALSVAGLAFTVGVWGRYINVPAYQIVSGQVAARKMDLVGWVEFLSGPGRWLASQEAKQRAASEQLRTQHPLPALDGTVDSIPSIQSALIANGLRYVPRPSIQQYATYTHRLIEKNREFFRGDRAPDFVLMAPEAIDGRYPPFAEGPIWPDLLARYAPVDIVGELAVLRKRDRPLDLPMRVMQTQSGTVGEPLVFEASTKGVIFARIDLQPTLLGRLASLLFKSAMLDIALQYVDGTQARYRFLPAIAREGFFLSPTIASAEAYLELASGLAKINPMKVKSFVIQPGTLAKWLWAKQFAVELDSMEDDALRADSMKSEMSPQAQQRLELLSVIDQAANAKLVLLPVGLLAHAPTKFSLPANAKRSLDVGFGIVDDAWQGEANTDGVCFRVTVPNAPAPTWERCLDPKQSSADRGPQQATITLPDGANTIELETACRNNCAWDWSYWSRVSLR
jgi:hypothetical protein